MNDRYLFTSVTRISDLESHAFETASCRGSNGLMRITWLAASRVRRQTSIAWSSLTAASWMSWRVPMSSVHSANAPLPWRP